MNITANTPRPKPSRKQRPGCITWVFLLLILLGPGRGILIALFQMIAPRTGSSLVWTIAAGIGVVGVVALVARAVARRPPDSRLPTGTAGAGERRQAERASMRPPGPSQFPGAMQSGVPAGPPRFEPIITGKVLVAGVVLAACFAAAILLLATSLGTRP